MTLLLVLALNGARVFAAAEFAVPGATSAPAGKMNDTLRDLQCIQLNAPAGTPIKGANATQIFTKLSPILDQAFEKLKFSPIERALFVSQAIEESGGFTQLSESKIFSNQGDSPIGHLASAIVNDEQFTQRMGAKGSSEFGQFRGRGLLQISRCDNFFSVVHYLNQYYKGKTDDIRWQGYWEIDETRTRRDLAQLNEDIAGEKNPINLKRLNGRLKDMQKLKERNTLNEVCTPKQIAKMKDQYRERYGMDANLYGLLDDPMRFAQLGMEFTDPVSKKKIDSEQLMVDSSIAYWRGRCSRHAQNIEDKEKLAAFPLCQQFKGNYAEKAAQCATMCIKGSTGGWEKRQAWLVNALKCYCRRNPAGCPSYKADS